MKHTFWDKRIPTILALLFLVIGVGVTTFVVGQTTNFFGHAAPPETPQQFRVTNITDTSFTVTYITAAAFIGTVSYGTDATISSGQVAFDDRDQATGIPKPYGVHSITIRNLKPSTQYFFSILSGGNTYLNSNTPFTAQTGPTISDNPPQQDPLAGKLLTPTGDNATDALIYVTTSTGQTLSTVVKDTGLYILPLNTLRTKDLSGYLILDKSTNLQLLAETSTLTSQAIITSDRINPVPTITLSNDYDFSINTQPLASTSAEALQFPVFPLDTSVNVTIKITQPSANESFTDSQPQFTGTALPNSQVSISIHSDNAIQATVTTDSSGRWTYRPPTGLAPGNHTISITTTDALGILKTITQNFVVYAQGTQVSQSATPSATLTPKPSVTPTTVPSSTPTVTIAPTTQASITQSVGTPTPTVVSNLLPTSTLTKGGLPPTGSNSLVTAGIFGIITTVIGVVLFFATHATPL